MIEKLGLEESKIPDLCNLLYKNYGTTMAGLRVSLLFTRLWVLTFFFFFFFWKDCLSCDINLCAGNWL